MKGFSCVPQVFARCYFHLCHQSMQVCYSYTCISPYQYCLRMKGICCFSSLITQYTNLMDFCSVTGTCRQPDKHCCCPSSIRITVWPFTLWSTMDVWMWQQLGKSVSFFISIQFYNRIMRHVHINSHSLTYDFEAFCFLFPSKEMQQFLYQIKLMFNWAHANIYSLLILTIHIIDMLCYLPTTSFITNFHFQFLDQVIY